MDSMIWDATNIVGTAIALLLVAAMLCMLAAQSVVQLRKPALRFLWICVALLVLHAAFIVTAKVVTGNGNYIRYLGSASDGPTDDQTLGQALLWKLEREEDQSKRAELVRQLRPAGAIILTGTVTDMGANSVGGAFLTLTPETNTEIGFKVVAEMRTESAIEMVLESIPGVAEPGPTPRFVVVTASGDEVTITNGSRITLAGVAWEYADGCLIVADCSMRALE